MGRSEALTWDLGKQWRGGSLGVRVEEQQKGFRGSSLNTAPGRGKERCGWQQKGVRVQEQQKGVRGDVEVGAGLGS